MLAARHIIVLFDGTDCTATRGRRRDLTNVFAIGAALNDHSAPGTANYSEQIILYFPGVGTGSLAAPLERALGHGLNSTVREAYLAIANNFRDGHRDKVYIFGYSRGAVAAKVLTTLLAKTGLVRRKFLHRFKHAWRYYKGDETAKVFLTDDVVQNVRIPFVGLFDPVSGPPFYAADAFYSETLDHCVDHAVEIVAYDECRLSYDEKLWRSDDLSGPPSAIAQTLSTGAANLQQIWMPGSHGDVGGHQGDRILGAISLLTMLERVQSRTSLKINEQFVQEQVDAILATHDLSIWRRRFYNYGWARAMFGRQRAVAKSGATFLHPVLDLFVGRTVPFRRKARNYVFRDSDFDAFNRYNFDLSGLLPARTNPQSGDLVLERVLDVLSQV